MFGGSGFIGSELVRTLRVAGMDVSVARRSDGRRAPEAGDDRNGRLDFVTADITDAESVRSAVAGADAVINLVGILFEKGRQTFTRVHEQGARNVAEAAAAAGVGRLVQMSALGASPQSPSAYARSKAAGERAVRDAFPQATIMRPSIVFGPDDDFFNKFAGMARFSPALPLIGGGRTRFQPVYVGDVAHAFVVALDADSAAGKTYELAGPRTYSFRTLLQLMLDTMGTRRVLVPVPFFVAELQGTVLGHLPTPPLTRDQVELLKTDNVAGGQEPGLTELGIIPTAVEEILPSYLG